jgi:hypothetical protein
MLVANASGEIDRDVYNGLKEVTAESLDLSGETFKRADLAD